MKKNIFTILMVSLLISPFSFSQEQSTSETKIEVQEQTNQNEKTISAYTTPDGRHLALSFAEITLMNIGLNFFDKTILDTSYSVINLNTMASNLKSAWVWDQDEFIINQFLHQYQGSMYFVGARANGFNYWQSLAINSYGVITWEYLMETEIPAYNDLIITTLQGAFFGEVFHRSYKALEDKAPFFAFMFSPQDSINKFFTGQRAPDLNYGKFDYGVFSGYSFNYSDIQKPYTDNISAFPTVSSIFAGFDVEYNNKYGHTTNDVFDQFNIRSWFLFNPYYNQINVFADGLLYSKCLNTENDTTIGMSQHYDLVYSEEINYQINAFGFTLRQLFESANPITENSHFKFGYTINTNFAFIGCSEFYDLNSLRKRVSDGGEEMRLYDFGIGPNVELDLNLSNKLFGDLNIYSGFSYLYTLPFALPIEGSKGYNIIWYSDIYYEHQVYKNWYLGINEFIFNKFGFYENASDYSSKAFTTNVYVKYKSSL